MQKLKGKILIVEDDPLTRELLRWCLQKRGLTILEAQNGREALEIAPIALPRLILLDLFMPFIDGFSVAHQIRRTSSLRSVPIIVMSAYNDLATRFFKSIHFVGTGPIEFLPKPFDPIQLEDLLDNLL